MAEKYDKILHEKEVEEVIDEELQDLSTQGPIADLGLPSTTYIQGEATTTRNTVNAMLKVLRDAGLIPT
jgi:hypothetical protein